MTKFLNISVDNTLGGNSPSDVVVSSQKAVKEYVDAHSGGGGSTAVDNLSITRNSSLQIQTVGVIDSNNTTNAIKTWTGTKAQYEAIITKNANTQYTCTDSGEIYLGTNLIANKAGNRNVGEIITSTIPLTDAGLHLLDGALISGAGSYSDFVTYISGLVTDYPDLFETEANWQTTVTTYGVCGKFVYDSVNNTVRLPKITGFTEGTIDPTVLGDLVQAGLPHPLISGAMIMYTGSGTGTAGLATNTTVTVSRTSNVNPIYGNSTTVQPQSVKVLYYIVIANSVKTNIEVDIDEVMTDLNGKADISMVNTALNGKADVDLSNVNASGTSLASGWAMPSTRYDDLTLGASGSTYTAPANGWFTVNKKHARNTNQQYFNMVTRDNNEEILAAVWSYSTANDGNLGGTIPVSKGSKLDVSYSASGSTLFFRFVYAEGEPNV